MEAVVAQFEVLFRHVSAGNTYSHKDPEARRASGGRLNTE
jgi:hypothetical protein